MKALNKSLLFATIAAALAVPMAAHAANVLAPVEI